MLPDLTTLANVKSWLSITGAGDDAELSRLVTAASGFVRAWCNRDFSLQTYTHTYNGKGTQSIKTRQYPIVAVTSLVIDTDVIPLAPDAISNGYMFSDTEIAVRGYRFNRGFQNIQVGYQAGFAVIPSDLEQAVIELIGLKRSQAKNNGLSSKGIANETTAFIVKDLLPGTQTNLNFYKRVRP